jgi:anthranilate phosphoribosyltransferase
MIREAIQQLVASEDLERGLATRAMDDIMNGEASESQIAGFLVGLRMKGETVDEIAGLVTSMREHATTIEAPTGAIDTCGTGGDGAGTFNISTAAAIVVRGCGVPVAKHGNRASSSQCGSADVFEALGVPVDLPAGAVEECLKRCGIAFLFAPTFHPAMRHAAATRKDIGVRTVFNFLGPLANPARVKRQALGVGNAGTAEKMVQVLFALGHERALVFYSEDGLDELSTVADSHVYELRDGTIREYVVDPGSLGLDRAVPADLKGGDAEPNAEIIRRVLDGQPGPQRDVVLLNAAAGLVAAGRADDLAQGIELAAAAIDDHAAQAALEDLRVISWSLVKA